MDKKYYDIFYWGLILILILNLINLVIPLPYNQLALSSITCTEMPAIINGKMFPYYYSILLVGIIVLALFGYRKGFTLHIDFLAGVYVADLILTFALHLYWGEQSIVLSIIIHCLVILFLMFAHVKLRTRKNKVKIKKGLIENITIILLVLFSATNFAGLIWPTKTFPSIYINSICITYAHQNTDSIINYQALSVFYVLVISSIFIITGVMLNREDRGGILISLSICTVDLVICILRIYMSSNRLPYYGLYFIPDILLILFLSMCLWRKKSFTQNDKGCRE